MTLLRPATVASHAAPVRLAGPVACAAVAGQAVPTRPAAGTFPMIHRANRPGEAARAA